MDKVNVLSIAVSTGSYHEFISSIMDIAGSGKSQYACVANVHMLIEAYNDFSFANVVSNASIITPDGKPLSWALRILYGIRQDRVAGMDLLPDLLREAVAKKMPVYFYGGQESMLAMANNYLKDAYPGLIIAGAYSPPFRQLSEPEEDAVADRINRSGARLVFVILGCPKQEKWMASMKGRVQAVMVGVGGALPVLIGLQKRAPAWMQQAGLEWLFRLLQEPVRLFKRYAVTNSKFLYLLFRAYYHRRPLNRAL